MNTATILASVEAALAAVQAAKALYDDVKYTLTSQDRATVDAKLVQLDAEATALTGSTLARLDQAAKT